MLLRRQEDDWYIFEVDEIDDSTKVPVRVGHFFVVAQDRRAASRAAQRTALSTTTWCVAARPLPAGLAKQHAGEWPNRISELLLDEIERDYPDVFERRDGKRRLVNPTKQPRFNDFIFTKAALVCLPLALLAGSLRHLVPDDVASSIPAGWRPAWLTLLLLATSFVVLVQVSSEDYRWPLWRIARRAALLFVAGLLGLAVFAT